MGMSIDEKWECLYVRNGNVYKREMGMSIGEK